MYCTVYTENTVSGEEYVVSPLCDGEYRLWRRISYIQYMYCICSQFVTVNIASGEEFVKQYITIYIYCVYVPFVTVNTDSGEECVIYNIYILYSVYISSL